MTCAPLLFVAVALLSTIAVEPAAAQMFPPLFRDIGIDQRPGAQVPLDAQFRDQTGASVRLGDYVHGKPVLLLPVYYTCTTLCSETLRGLVEGISPLSLHPGSDYEIVAFSINPEETPADALKQVNRCTMNYSGRHGDPGWHFLTGDAHAINAVTNAIGFHYRYDTQNKIFVHAAGLMILTPGGRVSRYLLGVTFQPSDLQQGLLASARGAIGPESAATRLLCYPFSAGSARYNRLVIRAIQCTAAAMLMALIGGLIYLWRADLRSRFDIAASRVRS